MVTRKDICQFPFFGHEMARIRLRIGHASVCIIGRFTFASAKI